MTTIVDKTNKNGIYIPSAKPKKELKAVKKNRSAYNHFVSYKIKQINISPENG